MRGASIGSLHIGSRDKERAVRVKLSHADQFADRHIGPSDGDVVAMLEAVGAESLDALIDEVVPSDIRLVSSLDVPGPDTEAGFLTRLRRLSGKNRPSRSLIGLGYYGCITPSVILRNVFENPGWYTPYTPYQAEVAQGRLEAELATTTDPERKAALTKGIGRISFLLRQQLAAEVKTETEEEKAKKKATQLAIGLGVGLGVGFPVLVIVGLKLAAPPTTINTTLSNDANQAMFIFGDKDTFIASNSLSSEANWLFVYSIGGSDYVTDL